MWFSDLLTATIVRKTTNRTLGKMHPIRFCARLAHFAEGKPPLRQTAPRQNRKLRLLLRSACTIFGIKFNPNANENAHVYFAYDNIRRMFGFVHEPCGLRRAAAVDRRPVRRHQGHPLRSARIRTASARTERVDLLPGRSGQVRSRHPLRPELRGQPADQAHARNALP